LTSSLPKHREREPEVVVPFLSPREKLAPAKSVRSTLVASSLNRVREHGHLEAYLANLDPQWTDAIFHAVAGVWLPIDAGAAHYQACEKLRLPAAEQLEIGREVGDRIQGTFLASMVRAAKGVGVTPWSAVAYSGKLYARLFDGGGIAVVKVGPKEARVEIARNVLTGNSYFRSGLRGLYQVAIELFCAKAYVVDAARVSADDSCTMKISWV
jgi:hypothetical protein